MGETRKIAAILVADVVGYSELAGADEDRTLARLRALRGDLTDPTIALHHGRTVKLTGDGALVEFRSVVDAVRCAVEIQQGMIGRNSGLPPEQRIEFRIGIHLGDVVEEADGDLMGDGVNIAARTRGGSRARRDLSLRGRLSSGHRQARHGSHRSRPDPAQKHRKIDPGLFAASGRPCRGETRAVRLVAPKMRSPLARLAARVAVLLIVLACGAWWLLGNYRPTLVETTAPAPVASNPTTPAEAKHLSIVVLPFANLSNDPSQDYFADGLTENLTTDLSRLGGSFVIARNTAFTFKGKNVDTREIGKELGVRYVLEGSVQRDASRMRVNVQLIDAESGKHLWAERFDKPLADLFEMQDEIVARLANQLGTELTSAEAHRAERASNPNSMDLFFQGLAALNKGINIENMTHARGYFERALALDPNNLDALLGVGRVDYSVGAALLSDDREARLAAAAETAIAKVLSLRPNDALAHEIMGGILIETKRADQGVAEFERALALDPNLATAHGFIGLAKIFVGHPEETGAHENEALRLSPRDSFAWLWLHFAGAAKMNLGAEEEAVALYRRSIENNRTNPLTHFFLAATLANLGKLEEAQAEAKAGLALDPGFSIRRFLSGGPQGEFLEGGMRKAGVPEG